MVKRKLRKCANCGGRHGPPTGKGCLRLAEEKPEETGVKVRTAREELEIDVESDVSIIVEEDDVFASNTAPEGEEETHKPFSSFRRQDVIPNYGDEDDFRQRWAAEDVNRSRARTSQHGAAKREMSPEVFHGRVPASNVFERRISDKVIHREPRSACLPRCHRYTPLSSHTSLSH